MKLNLRQATWALSMAIALALFGAPNFADAFQSQEGLEHGRGHDQDRDYTRNRNYQLGLNDGREDGARNRDRRYRLRTNNDADRRAYQAGYDQGYQDARRGGYDRDRDRNYNGPNGPSGQYGRNVPYGNINNLAAQAGAQDGLNDGRKDRATGHSNRPTEGDNYRSATRGFPGGDGETDYKATYRQAYVPAYQRGYNEQSSGGYGQTSPYGRYDNLAAQMGAQDGLNDGRKDRATGHSNRPTQGDNYKNATRGFPGGDGETAYKAAYRQAYTTAYERGYNEQNSGCR